MRFWDFQSNCSQTTCRTTLIFLLLDRAMSEQHFSYLGHAHICSRKFSRRTWKKVFVKKSTFFKLLSRKFWLFKSLKNKILRLSEQFLTNYESHDPNFFYRWIELCQSNIFHTLVMPISALENFLGGLEKSFRQKIHFFQVFE